MLQFVVDQPQQPIEPPDPDEDESATDLASKLHATERQASSVIEGVYRPLRLPGLHDALGVAARWHTAAQDIEFERRLLLRALLTALPPSAYSLPLACATIDDLDLAPIKVQAVLEALTARRRVDLADAEFRWDHGHDAGAALAPLGPWGGAERHGAPPFGGLSKRQLELASFELLLQGLGASRVLQMQADGDARLPRLRAVAVRLGITGREQRRMLAALRRAEETEEGAARRCALAYRLRALRENLPADFESDGEFYAWQERQAALVGCALHARLRAHAARFEPPEQSPAAGMEALVVRRPPRPAPPRQPSLTLPMVRARMHHGVGGAGLSAVALWGVGRGLRQLTPSCAPPARHPDGGRTPSSWSCCH